MLRRTVTATSVLLIMLSIAACARTVKGIDSNGQAFELTIVDPQALAVTASAVTAQDELAGAIDGVDTLDAPNAIAVTWGGLPCERQPTLVISEEEGSRITIEIDRGPQSGSFCPAMEVRFSVALELKRPGDVGDIDFEIGPAQEP